MNCSKEARVFPNECYVCKSASNLRCECDVISYCGEIHRLLHLPIHDSFCKAVLQLASENSINVNTAFYPRINDPHHEADRQELYQKLTAKLTRPLSTLENALLARPRICFVCGDIPYLENCPTCPIVSFCHNHPNTRFAALEHKKNCLVMKKYLNLLSTADDLNVDLQFLPSCFPFIQDESKSEIDPLAEVSLAYSKITDNDLCQSRMSKIHLLHFISIASKFHTALLKLYSTVPSEIMIHLDALQYQHVIVKENYWEFLLHSESNIKILKIVITGSEDFHDLKNSLCEKCRSMGKEMSIEIYSKPYEEFMLQENYQKPDVLFYFKIEDEQNSQRMNIWSKVDCPVVLLIDSEEKFCKIQYSLSSVSAKFQAIYEGQIYTPFKNTYIFEKDDYVIILQSKTIEPRPKSRVDDSSAEEVVDKALLVPQDETKQTETGEKQKPENVNSLSPASSVSSFIIISEPGDDDSTAKEVINENLEPGENNSYAGDEDNVDREKSEYLGENPEEIADKQNQVSAANNVEKYISILRSKIDKLQEQLNSSNEKNSKSQKEILKLLKENVELQELCYDANENEMLRKENKNLHEHLNSSVGEITQLEKRNLELQDICSKLIKNNELMKKTFIDNDELKKRFG